MHEVSLARNIIQTLQQEFSSEELDKLTAIDLKVGLLSNVEPVLMKNAFGVVAEEQPNYKHVKLDIEVVPVKIKCEVCGTISDVHNYVFKCANGHPCTNIIEGNELRIEKVHFST